MTIRCAQIGNNQIGVTYGMLDRVDAIIAAFEVEKNQYKLIEISPALYKKFLRDSKNEGHVGLVQKRYLEAHGKTFHIVSI